MEKLPARAELWARYDYDPDTGRLTHKGTDRPALATPMQGTGYLRGKLGKRVVRAHRVIWKMVHGTEPEAIDHINGVPADNRLENLRAVTASLNQRNRRKGSNNSSGVVGVHRRRGWDTWRAIAYVERKKIDLGSYKSLAEAATARATAIAALGFTDRHGNE